MILYFQDSQGKLREIAQFEDGKSDKEYLDAAHKEIVRFCNTQGYAIPYVRIWNKHYDGKQITMFDVGSHTEFFFLSTAVNIKAGMFE